MKEGFKNRLFSITSYVIVGVIAVHVVLIPLFYITITDTYKKGKFEGFVTHATEVSGLLSNVMSSKDFNINRDEIRNILSASVLGGTIQYLDVSHASGEILYPQDIVKGIGKEFVEETRVGSGDDEVYYLSVPVFFKGENLVSKLRVGIDESTVIEDYEGIKKDIMLFILVYLVVTILLISASAKIVHRPLHLLSRRSREIAEGDLAVPLSINSKLTEIKDLAGDLEAMRVSLVSLAERMQHKATHDELTGLPNRYLFNDRLEQSIALAGRENKQFAILLLDLDRFKEINDTLGHGVGDDVLSIVSERMLEGLRESDTVARIGGDEFSFVLSGVGHVLAEKMAYKVIELILPAFDVKGHSLKIGASIGISVYPDDGGDIELLMRRADVAMYHAKQNNLQVASYFPEMDSDHYEKLVLANDLGESILEGHFAALFQPKVDLYTGQPCGCELLLRWQHPTLGLIYPEKFIPLAERENLIGDLTRWVVSKHLYKFSEIIRKRNDFHVSINISPVSLLDNALYESIREVIQISQFPSGNLFIEVTENAIMKNPIRSTEVLGKFSKMGVAVSIDDFGTGYSSLSYLQKFPISELKIDKSFINDLTMESSNYPIVNATIAMAHDLGLSVVAEGVEDSAVLELLNELGCDRVQGYYYSKPVRFEELVGWLEEF